MPRLIVNIKADGTSTIEAEGFVGKACGETIDRILSHVGGTVTSREHKPEYYDEPVNAGVEVEGVVGL